MCYPVCGMVHIKEPLLLIRQSSLCGGSGFPLSLSELKYIFENGGRTNNDICDVLYFIYCIKQSTQT